MLFAAIDLGNMQPMAYLLAGLLFVFALGGLASHESARRGNLYGVLGMALAFLATLADPRVNALPVILGAVAVGGAVGAVLAKRVEMTSMPELTAALHSFVGLAAVLVGLSSYLNPGRAMNNVEHVVHAVEITIDVAIGALTFTGSVVAWGKLQGRISGRALLLPGRHLLNLSLLAMIIGGGALVCFAGDGAALGLSGFGWLLVIVGVAAVLGVHLVMAIGGADMPVVVSLLNSYSGWTAAAAGFMLENDLLIVTGALVGSSGAILSIIMCRAMNRSILNVVFGGFGATPAAASAVEQQGQQVEISTEELCEVCLDAREVIVVPGYGMAVAQAQRVVDELCRTLQARGARVRFAIHPVAGRLPGHMNVLLAEAGVPYDVVMEMDEINEDFPETDLVLVIGANDIVNPSAQTDPASPIAGMPVLEAWKARLTVVLKRGKGAGYAGVENPLFFLDNTRMYYGDARKSMEKLVLAVKSASAS